MSFETRYADHELGDYAREELLFSIGGFDTALPARTNSSIS